MVVIQDLNESGDVNYVENYDSIVKNINNNGALNKSKVLPIAEEDINEVARHDEDEAY